MSEKYDITGPGGATTFMTLPPGVILRLADGSRAELMENPRDGAFVLVKYLECPNDPSRVGEQQPVFFNEVKEVE